MSPYYETEATADVLEFEQPVHIVFRHAALDTVAEADFGDLVYLATKRTLDIVIATIILGVTLPLLILVAIAIKCTDGGPVFFTQTRVGKHGRQFKCFKFRSMIPNADALKESLLLLNKHEDPRTFKLNRDPRITWIGRIIRKASIDEVPQLLNVLRGEMSLVGPRPPVPGEVTHYTNHDWRRLEVRPGLTCIWQVSGRGDLPFSEQVRLDVKYVENRSFLLDLKLLLLTIPAVITGRGAY